MVDKKKQKFIGLLAQKVLSGEISQELFKRLELAVNYSDELKIHELGDPAALAVVDWFKRRGLERAWTFTKTGCPGCSKESYAFENKNLMLVICPNCMGEKTSPLLTMNPGQKDLQGLSAQVREIILRAEARAANLSPQPK
ncbi:MAG: hypothetical protein E6K86_02325 [Thaumarchaeota archaeon]|nr:MAG: hypothetical protein E6K86_02325 [Nitrososphaerota archaeon]